MSFNDSFFNKIYLKEIFKSGGQGWIDIDCFDRKHLKNSFSDNMENLFQLGLFIYFLLLLQNSNRNHMIPRKGKHKGECVCQHASILNQIQRFHQQFASNLNVKQPCKVTPIFDIFTRLRMFLFKLKFLHTLFKFFVKSDEKGDFLDQIVELRWCLFIVNGHIFCEIFESYHDLIKRMRF